MEIKLCLNNIHFSGAFNESIANMDTDIVALESDMDTVDASISDLDNKYGMYFRGFTKFGIKVA